MNTEMTACCQADCGECSDTSDLCDAARQDEKNPHGRESTCCPATMLAGDLPSCENSMAPCAVPESVRNPPDLTSITAADVHAKDDCGEVQKATKDSQHLHTAFLKFQGKEFTTKTEHGGCLTTSDCGSYGTLEQAAAACSNNDDCLAFDTDSEGKPDCLIMAEEKIMTLTSGSNDVYIKREFHFTGETFGLRSVSHDCFRKNPSGALKVKLGFCTSQIAMNELDGAEVYTDLPRAACAPTPSPTPATTTVRFRPIARRTLTRRPATTRLARTPSTIGTIPTRSAGRVTAIATIFCWRRRPAPTTAGTAIERPWSVRVPSPRATSRVRRWSRPC